MTARKSDKKLRSATKVKPIKPLLTIHKDGTSNT